MCSRKVIPNDCLRIQVANLFLYPSCLEYRIIECGAYPRKYPPPPCSPQPGNRVGAGNGQHMIFPYCASNLGGMGQYRCPIPCGPQSLNNMPNTQFRREGVVQDVDYGLASFVFHFNLQNHVFIGATLATTPLTESLREVETAASIPHPYSMLSCTTGDKVNPSRQNMKASATLPYAIFLANHLHFPLKSCLSGYRRFSMRILS